MTINNDRFAEYLKSPASHFRLPAEVLQNPELDRAQKIEILKSWKHEETELLIASEENMRGDSSGCLDDVVDALSEIEEEEA